MAMVETRLAPAQAQAAVPKRLSVVIAWGWALVIALGAGTVHAQGNGNGVDLMCEFRARGLSLNFGALNPSSGANVTAMASAATMNADQAGDCTGMAMTITGDSGQNFLLTRRLRNAATGDFIAYTLTLPGALTAPGNNRYTAFTLQGSIQGTDYANASAGLYSDSVLITITP